MSGEILIEDCERSHHPSTDRTDEKHWEDSQYRQRWPTKYHFRYRWQVRPFGRNMPANSTGRLENNANFHGACTYVAHQQAEVAENLVAKNMAFVRLPPSSLNFVLVVPSFCALNRSYNGVVHVMPPNSRTIFDPWSGRRLSSVLYIIFLRQISNILLFDSWCR